MAHAAHEIGAPAGAMDVTEHKRTFHGFLRVAAWVCTYVAMSVAGLVTAFAIGAGWFAGLAAFAAVGAGAGAFMRFGLAFWISLLALTVLLALGGAVILAVF
jgi:hypothetical protein